MCDFPIQVPPIVTTLFCRLHRKTAGSRQMKGNRLTAQPIHQSVQEPTNLFGCTICNSYTPGRLQNREAAPGAMRRIVRRRTPPVSSTGVTSALEGIFTAWNASIGSTRPFPSIGSVHGHQAPTLILRRQLHTSEGSCCTLATADTAAL